MLPHPKSLLDVESAKGSKFVVFEPTDSITHWSKLGITIPAGLSVNFEFSIQNADLLACPFWGNTVSKDKVFWHTLTISVLWFYPHIRGLVSLPVPFMVYLHKKRSPKLRQNKKIPFWNQSPHINVVGM